MSIKLTKKQQLVYDFIAEFMQEHDYSPSYRDICAGVGLSSVASVAEHVDNLAKLGAMKKVPGAARSLEVVDFTYPETVALFRAKMETANAEDLEILRKSAKILGIEMESE